MAKWANDNFMDAALTYVKGQVDILIVCSAQPTTYTEATVTYALADVSVATGDFTLADGTTNGRKLTFGGKSGVTIDATGTATHIALVKSGDTTLRYITTCNNVSLTAGGGATVDVPSWAIEIADPS